MGADYYCYTEIKRNNQWYAFNGMYYNEKTDNYEIAVTYYSGSRTYFSRTYDKLREIGSMIMANELSKKVLEKEDWLAPDDSVVAVSLNELRKAVPQTTRKQCCGYVHKRHIWECEVEQCAIDEYLSAEEYDELSDAEKKEYEFYEFNDPMDWYLNLKNILDIVSFQIDSYMNINEMLSEPAEIRLVCIASF